MKDGFREFLEGRGYTAGGVNSRISRAAKAEELIGADLDTVVSEDARMYKAMLLLRDHDTNGNLQNAVRLYYVHRNGREFPKLAMYEKQS